MCCGAGREEHGERTRHVYRLRNRSTQPPGLARTGCAFGGPGLIVRFRRKQEVGRNHNGPDSSPEGMQFRPVILVRPEGFELSLRA